eukprot:gene5637-7015_t
MNCSSNLGGALHVHTSRISLSNIKFIQNKASLGGAIYFFESIAMIRNVSFQDNSCLSNGGDAIFSVDSAISLYTRVHIKNSNDYGPYNIISKGESSEIEFSNGLDTTNIKVNCQSNGKILQHGENLCINRYYNSIMSTDPETCDCIKSITCSCSFSGLVQKQYISSSINSLEFNKDQPSVVSTVISIDMKEFLNEKLNPVLGVINGYFTVEKSDQYEFRLVVEDLQVNVTIDGFPFFQTPLGDSMESKDFLYLGNRNVHSIRVSFIGIPEQKKRKLSLEWKKPGNSIFTQIDSLFFSQNRCGDRINDPTESGCEKDKDGLKPNQYQCGNGICGFRDPNECLVDCHYKITPTCPTRSVPKKHIPPGFYINYDTLGDLISNQFVWHAPGSEQFTFGMNIIDGVAAASPLFYFGYCDEQANYVLEDVYRGIVYQLPQELSGKAFPSCSYETSSSLFSTSGEIASEKNKKSSMDIEGSLDVKVGPISGQAEAAFSKEKSTKAANSLKTSNSTSIIRTELKCIIYSYQLEKYSFHPVFLKDLSQSETVDDFYELIQKYGTHFMTRSTMGCSLVQMTATQSMVSENENLSEWEESAKKSFSASVQSRSFSASGSYSDSLDSNQSGKDHQKKEKKSSRSTVITYGERLGSYGPSGEKHNENYEEWVKSLDVLPVAIDFQIKPIRAILDDHWKTRSDQPVFELWKEAEQLFYQRNQPYTKTGRKRNYSLIFNFAPPAESNFVPKLENFEINWEIPLLDFNGNVIKDTNLKKKLKIPFVYSNNVDLMDFYLTKGFPLGENYTISSNILDPNIIETYHHHLENSLISPYRFDFKTEEDFFSSITRPSIYNGNYNNNFYTMAIISWETGQSIIFQSNWGAVVNNEIFNLLGYEAAYVKQDKSFTTTEEWEIKINGINFYKTNFANEKSGIKPRWHNWDFFSWKYDSLDRRFDNTYTVNTESSHFATRLNYMIQISSSNNSSPRPWLRDVDAWYRDPATPIYDYSEFITNLPNDIYKGLKFQKEYSYKLVPLAKFINPKDLFYFQNFKFNFKSRPNLELMTKKLDLNYISPYNQKLSSKLLAYDDAQCIGAYS